MKRLLPILFLILAGCSTMSEGQQILASRSAYNAALSAYGIALDQNAVTLKEAEEFDATRKMVGTLIDNWQDAYVAGEDFDVARVLIELERLLLMQQEATDGSSGDSVIDDGPDPGGE